MVDCQTELPIVALKFSEYVRRLLSQVFISCAWRLQWKKLNMAV